MTIFNNFTENGKKYIPKKQPETKRDNKNLIIFGYFEEYENNKLLNSNVYKEFTFPLPK